MVGAQCVSHEMKYSTADGNYEEIELICRTLSKGQVKISDTLNSVAGSTISNDSTKNQIIIICVSAAVIVVLAVIIVVITKKKKNN